MQQPSPIDSHVVVGDEHFEYLRLQKGSLDQWAHDRAEWHRRYENDLRDTFEMIAPHLPDRCWGMLDIGSGMGGIDVLIGRHYEKICGRPYTHLLDGVNDRPVMTLHRHTYNDMRVAKDFQQKNGLPPERFGYFGTREQFYTRPYDLVVSFGSWCFHYPPNTYLRELMKGGGLHGESVVICDVRAAKPDWMEELAAFDRVAVIATRPKWLRCVFKLR